MREDELERYLHEHIPLSRTMAVAVKSASETGVVLGAPLAPNINHRDTLFGGSASAIAILAAWCLVHVRLLAQGLEARVIIQRNTMRYSIPVDGDFVARSFLDPKADWQDFVATLATGKPAPITVQARIEHEGRVAARLEGRFVALPGAGKADGE